MVKVPPFLFFLSHKPLWKVRHPSLRSELSREVNPPYFEPSSSKEPKRERSRITGLFGYPNLQTDLKRGLVPESPLKALLSSGRSSKDKLTLLDFSIKNEKMKLLNFYPAIHSWY